MPLRACAVACLLFWASDSIASPITVDVFSSSATTLDFEALASGETVRDQYLSDGVRLYGHGRDQDGDPVQPHSGEMVIALSNIYRTSPRGGEIGPFRLVATSARPEDSVGSNVGTIGVQFLDPVSGNAATTDAAGLWVYNHSTLPTAFSQLDAFDIDGNLIESFRLIGGWAQNRFLGISAPGIHRLEVFTGYDDNLRVPDGFNVDDITFSALVDSGFAPAFIPPVNPVPEPSTVLLVGAGVTLLTRRRHSSRR